MSDKGQDPNVDVATLKARLSMLQTRETEARSILEFIAEERAVVERQLAQQRATVHPISRLPAELLILIFEFSAAYDDFEPFSLLSDALAISHVCRSWRTLALETSALWTCIHVGAPILATLFLRRAGQTPIDIVGTSCCSGDAFEVAAHLRSARAQWRSVAWAESGDKVLLRSIFSDLNDRESFPSLEKLLLECRPNTQPIRLDAWSFRGQANHLARLQVLELREVPLSEIPPVPLPALRSIELSFEPTAGGLSAFRMSSFLPLINRSPNVHEMTMRGVPILDVSLSLDPEMISTSMLHRRMLVGHHRVPSSTLKDIREFDWSLAPSRDLWAMFFFVGMPSLELLRLCLAAGDKHWKHPDGQHPAPIDPPPGMSQHPLVAILPSLREITVECYDTDSLSSTLKKIRFPKLRKLTLICNVSETTPISQLSQLPRLESIFHEPRLPTLTKLVLRSFQLDTDSTLSMLRYMPALSHLTLNACGGAGAVLCRLSGGSCANAHRNTQRGWIAPCLTHIVLLDCPDAKFSCLAALVCARRAAPPADALLALAPGTPTRQIKRLRRRLPQGEGVQSAPATPRGKGMWTRPDSPLRPDTAASPNGSFVAGWASHEPAVRASAIASVRVEGCRRVSEAEALSLLQKEYGVTDVIWDT